MKRVVAVASVAIVLAACGTPDAITPRDASKDRGGRRTGAATLEMAESSNPDIATLGEGCEHGRAPRIDPPDASWNTETITAFEDSNGEGILIPAGGARLRYPRHWARAGGNVFEVSYSGPEPDAGRSEVEVHYMTTAPAPDGTSPWDVRIQAMEEGLSLEATAATPLPGGRCLVEGQRYAGPAVVLLFPLGGDNTLVASAEFIYLSDWQREFEEIPADDREVALEILNSVEFVEQRNRATS